MNERIQNENIIDNLRNAINNGEEDVVFLALEDINRQLIGENGTYVVPKEYADDIRNFVQGNRDSAMVYLGDGGVSRLHMRRYNGEVSISIGKSSSDEVRKKFGTI